MVGHGGGPQAAVSGGVRIRGVRLMGFGFKPFLLLMGWAMIHWVNGRIHFFQSHRTSSSEPK